MSFPHTSEQFEEVKRQSVLRGSHEPRIEKARFDAKAGLLSVIWRGGAELRLPARSILPLQAATEEQISGVAVVDDGTVLSWDTLNVQMTAITFVHLALGWRTIQSKGGSVKTDAKASAARANGAKGGRPRKNPEGY